METTQKRRQRIDSISVDQTYYTDEGYLIDHPIVTTCGIFEYKNPDGTTRRELRLPEYVFDERSLASYKGKPIIITHDAGEVDKENVRREQIGTIMSEGYRDGENVRVEIIIHDTNALKRCGLKELSLGYSLDTDETPGVYRGEKYDCIQKNIEINHLALVAEARAGEEARLNIDGKDEDAQILKGGTPIMYKPNTKRRRSDEGEGEGLSPEELEAAIALYKAQQAASMASVEGTDGDEDPEETPAEEPEKSPAEQVRENIDRRDAEGEDMTPEQIIEEQKEDLNVLLEEIDRLQAESDMSNADEEEEEPVGDEEDLPAGEQGTENPEEGDPDEENRDSDEEEKKVNADSVDRIVKQRLDICRMADKLNLDGIDRLSVKEGKKRIIRAVNPKINLDGKSASYINAAYDIAKQSFNERKSTDDQRRRMAMNNIRRDASEESSSVSARRRMIKRMTGGNR